MNQKYSSVDMKSGVHDSNNQEIIWLEGDTYSCRDILKRLGFTWYGPRKIWWMYKYKYNNNKNNIDNEIEKINGQVATAPIVTPIVAPVNEPVQKPVVSISQENEIKTDMTTNTDKWSYVKFPINEKIYEYDLHVVYESNNLVLRVVWGRGKDEQGHKTFPLYTIRVFLGENLIYTKKLHPPENGKWTSGPTYSESKMIKDYDEVLKVHAIDPKWKLYQAIKRGIELTKRDDGYKELLKKIKDNEIKELPDRKVYLEEYKQEFNLKLEPYVLDGDMTISLYADVDHELAPKHKWLDSLKVSYNVKTLEELDVYIDKMINSEAVKKEYREFLSSFAFTKEQRESGEKEFKPIADMILNENMNVGYFKTELLKRGFIRPSKREKQVAGLAAKGSFRLIIDDKKIRDFTFDRKHNKTGDFFYTAIAYNLMRIKHNNIGFMPILLENAYRDVVDGIRRNYKVEITLNQVANYVDKVARAIYNELTGKKYRSWDEVYGDFNSWMSGEEKVGDSALNTFAFFADGLDMGVTKEEALANPKSAYRKLVVLLHPDSTKLEDKERATEMFVDLTELYDKLPQQYRNAGNWYSRIKVGVIKTASQELQTKPLMLDVKESKKLTEEQMDWAYISIEALEKLANSLSHVPKTMDLVKHGHGVKYGSCGHKMGCCRCKEGHSIHYGLEYPCRKCRGRE